MFKNSTMKLESTNDEASTNVLPFAKRMLGEDYAGNWVEDFSHENGNYLNNCISCKKDFIGHKRRVVCKVCAFADVIIVDDDGIGKAHTLASLKDCTDVLIRQTTKEAKQLHEIIETDRGITINASHHIISKKKSNKKPFWKNGKLRYK
jgi:hypothetical protein